MGLSNGLCGALSGGMMAVGVLFGRDEPGQADEKKLTYLLTKRLVEAFEGAVGSRHCSDLLGFNLADDPEFMRFEAEECGKRICRPAAEEAAALVIRLATDAGKSKKPL